MKSIYSHLLFIWEVSPSSTWLWTMRTMRFSAVAKIGCFFVHVWSFSKWDLGIETWTVAPSRKFKKRLQLITVSEYRKSLRKMTSFSGAPTQLNLLSEGHEKQRYIKVRGMIPILCVIGGEIYTFIITSHFDISSQEMSSSDPCSLSGLTTDHRSPIDGVSHVLPLWVVSEVEITFLLIDKRGIAYLSVVFWVGLLPALSNSTTWGEFSKPLWRILREPRTQCHYHHHHLLNILFIFPDEAVAPLLPLSRWLRISMYRINALLWYWFGSLSFPFFSSFLDPPTLEVGPIDRPMSVRPFVRSSVCPDFFSITGHRIFLKLGMKFQDNNGHEVTKPDFPGKIWFIQKLQKCVQK